MEGERERGSVVGKTVTYFFHIFFEVLHISVGKKNKGNLAGSPFLNFILVTKNSVITLKLNDNFCKDFFEILHISVRK